MLHLKKMSEEWTNYNSVLSINHNLHWKPKKLNFEIKKQIFDSHLNQIYCLFNNIIYKKKLH